MIHDVYTNHADTRAEPPMNNTPQRKRWVAAASCVGLVAAAAGAGYWWHSTRVPDLTRIEAWSRYMELIESGKYDEALSYSPYLQDTSRNGNHIEFLSDAAHAHAPSTVSIEPVGNVNNTYAIEGVFPSTTAQKPWPRPTPCCHRRTRPMASLVGGTLTPHPSDQQSPSWS